MESVILVDGATCPSKGLQEPSSAATRVGQASLAAGQASLARVEQARTEPQSSPQLGPVVVLVTFVLILATMAQPPPATLNDKLQRKPLSSLVLPQM
ncbi:hypothetical protein E2C01_035298 [Portunus trituberculatus]|uniref:Uncharacterized protein n=1 Tax=Portunus trituberculatus TaxID=210409 RepID=A0A5B7F840_PORTR|nr:hypothetical protein [Portunus trituberculatus]